MGDGMTSGDNTDERRRVVGVLAVAAIIMVILVTPPFWSVQKIGIQAIFNYFKQDTFYYLAIASNSQTGFYTFDGELATSGFHPLWQMLVTGLYNAFPAMSQVSQIFLVFSLSVILTTLGYVLTGMAVYNITKSKLLGILIVPGFFYLAFSFVTPYENSPWSYMNGMESSLSIFFGGCLFVLLSVFHNDSEDYPCGAWFFPLLGVVLALILMTRLDDVFLVAAFGICMLFLGKGALGKRFANAVIVVMPSVLVLISYLVFNQYSVGTYLPISGLAKGGLTLELNLRQFVLLSELKPFPLSMNAYVQFFEIYYRHIQMLFPMLLAGLFIVVIRKGGDEFQEIRDKSMFLVALLVYVLFKGLYNLANVHVNHQGISWYYPISITSVNFVALVLLSRVYRQFLPKNRLIRIWAAAALSLFVAVHVITATATTMNVRTHGSRVYRFWRNADSLATRLRSKSPGLKLVEFDDGFMTYSLGIPAMHGIGFVLDYQGFKAKKEGRFLEYCYNRGFNTIASLQYVPLKNSNLSSEEIAKLFKKSRFFGKEDLSTFNFKVLLVDKNTGATFVRFEPKTKHIRSGT
jgi:lipid-A-disaccharide synthase-like uncharacterized protein